MYITSSENRTFQTLNHFVRLDICFKKKKKKSVLYICRSLDYGRLEFETTKCCMSFREYVPIERTVYRVIPPVTRSTLKIVTDNRVNECIRVFIIYWKTSRRIIIIARFDEMHGGHRWKSVACKKYCRNWQLDILSREYFAVKKKKKETCIDCSRRR